jgi:hypothetical protein
LLQEQHESAGVINWNPKACGPSFVIAHLADHHESIDINFYQALVVLHRLQSLHLNVIGFQA